MFRFCTPSAHPLKRRKIQIPQKKSLKIYFECFFCYLILAKNYPLTYFYRRANIESIKHFFEHNPGSGALYTRTGNPKSKGGYDDQRTSAVVYRWCHVHPVEKKRLIPAPGPPATQSSKERNLSS